MITIIRHGEKAVAFQLVLDMDLNNLATLSGADAGLFKAFIGRLDTGRDPHTIEFDLRTDDVILRGCSYYSTGNIAADDSGSFKVSYRESENVG